ncbi:MAG: hypothetical protein WAK93_06495, partial [Solirubrobacteraceae bacterium]
VPGCSANFAKAASAGAAAATATATRPPDRLVTQAVRTASASSDSVAKYSALAGYLFGKGR